MNSRYFRYFNFKSALLRHIKEESAIRNWLSLPPHEYYWMSHKSESPLMTHKLWPITYGALIIRHYFQFRVLGVTVSSFVNEFSKEMGSWTIGSGIGISQRSQHNQKKIIKDLS